MKNSLRPPIGIGIPTVLTILVALLLCSFSAMSLLSASADARLTEKAKSAVVDYYDADTQAERKVAQIERALQSGSGWQQRIEALGVTVSIENDHALLEFTIYQERQSMHIELDQLLRNGIPNGPFVRTLWQLVPGEPQ